jgi:hypothetical protein
LPAVKINQAMPSNWNESFMCLVLLQFPVYSQENQRVLAGQM